MFIANDSYQQFNSTTADNLAMPISCTLSSEVIMNSTIHQSNAYKGKLKIKKRKQRLTGKLIKLPKLNTTTLSEKFKHGNSTLAVRIQKFKETYTEQSVTGEPIVLCPSISASCEEATTHNLSSLVQISSFSERFHLLKPSQSSILKTSDNCSCTVNNLYPGMQQHTNTPNQATCKQPKRLNNIRQFFKSTYKPDKEPNLKRVKLFAAILKGINLLNGASQSDKEQLHRYNFRDITQCTHKMTHNLIRRHLQYLRERLESKPQFFFDYNLWCELGQQSEFVTDYKTERQTIDFDLVKEQISLHLPPKSIQLNSGSQLKEDKVLLGINEAEDCGLSLKSDHCDVVQNKSCNLKIYFYIYQMSKRVLSKHSDSIKTQTKLSHDESNQPELKLGKLGIKRPKLSLKEKRIKETAFKVEKKRNKSVDKLNMIAAKARFEKEELREEKCAENIECSVEEAILYTLCLIELARTVMALSKLYIIFILIKLKFQNQFNLIHQKDKISQMIVNLTFIQVRSKVTSDTADWNFSAIKFYGIFMTKKIITVDQCKNNKAGPNENPMNNQSYRAKHVKDEDSATDNNQTENHQNNGRYSNGNTGKASKSSSTNGNNQNGENNSNGNNSNGNSSGGSGGHNSNGGNGNNGNDDGDDRNGKPNHHDDTDDEDNNDNEEKSRNKKKTNTKDNENIENIANSIATIAKLKSRNRNNNKNKNIAKSSPKKPSRKKPEIEQQPKKPRIRNRKKAEPKNSIPNVKAENNIKPEIKAIVNGEPNQETIPVVEPQNNSNQVTDLKEEPKTTKSQASATKSKPKKKITPPQEDSSKYHLDLKKVIDDLLCQDRDQGPIEERSCKREFMVTQKNGEFEIIVHRILPNGEKKHRVYHFSNIEPYIERCVCASNKQKTPNNSNRKPTRPSRKKKIVQEELPEELPEIDFTLPDEDSFEYETESDEEKESKKIESKPTPKNFSSIKTNSKVSTNQNNTKIKPKISNNIVSSNKSKAVTPIKQEPLWSQSSSFNQMTNDSIKKETDTVSSIIKDENNLTSKIRLNDLTANISPRKNMIKLVVCQNPFKPPTPVDPIQHVVNEKIIKTESDDLQWNEVFKVESDESSVIESKQTNEVEKTIKNELMTPGTSVSSSIVCIVGPGSSGTTQAVIKRTSEMSASELSAANLVTTPIITTMSMANQKSSLSTTIQVPTQLTPIRHGDSSEQSPSTLPVTPTIKLPNITLLKLPRQVSGSPVHISQPSGSNSIIVLKPDLMQASPNVSTPVKTVQTNSPIDKTIAATIENIKKEIIDSYDPSAKYSESLFYENTDGQLDLSKVDLDSDEIIPDELFETIEELKEEVLKPKQDEHQPSIKKRKRSNSENNDDLPRAKKSAPENKESAPNNVISIKNEIKFPKQTTPFQQKDDKIKPNILSKSPRKMVQKNRENNTKETTQLAPMPIQPPLLATFNQSATSLKPLNIASRTTIQPASNFAAPGVALYTKMPNGDLIPVTMLSSSHLTTTLQPANAPTISQMRSPRLLIRKKSGLNNKPPADSKERKIPMAAMFRKSPTKMKTPEKTSFSTVLNGHGNGQTIKAINTAISQAVAAKNEKMNLVTQLKMPAGPNTSSIRPPMVKIVNANQRIKAVQTLPQQTIYVPLTTQVTQVAQPTQQIYILQPSTESQVTALATNLNSSVTTTSPNATTPNNDQSPTVSLKSPITLTLFPKNN